MYNNYISCMLIGRTGNIMFEIAHALAKALEYNRHLIIPKVEYLKNNILRKFEMGNIDIDENKMKIIEYPFHYVEKDTPSLSIPTIYKGYFQSEKYFKKYTNIIKYFYRPTEDFKKQAYIDFPYLKDSIVGVINVRRGDYLLQPKRHPVISIEYIYEAINNLPKCDYYFILSDDLDWCKENIKIKNIIFVDNYWDYNGIWLMSLCHNFVISNSSFSWWSAYLSENINKKVVSPSMWVGPDISDNIGDIWCEDWIKIPCKYDNGILKLL